MMIIFTILIYVMNLSGGVAGIILGVMLMKV